MEEPMKKIRIEKVVVNIGVGSSGEKLSKAMQILEMITGQKPVPRKAKRTIKEFKIKKGENIACIVTLRKEKAKNFLYNALAAIGNKVKARWFDDKGNMSFGIKECIQIPGVKYDPNLGIFGMDVCVSLSRPGYRVKLRRRKRSKIGRNHLVSREEAMNFFRKEFNVEIIGE
jgi:large subunit ribosomal protein L5